MSKTISSRVLSSPEFDRRHYPWLDRNGAPFSDDKLKLVSRSWSQRLWERYLTTLEKKQSEFLSPHSGKIQYVGKRDIARWIHENNEDFFEEAPESLAEETRKSLHLAMQCLTPREWQVIESIFYDGFSQSQTGIRLGISKERVHYLLKHSLKKIRKELIVNASDVCQEAGFTFTQGRGG
jgi:RNA polymerase sigma factor (sigma-70 family)